MSGGGGGSAQHIPHEAADSLRSRATARILDILSEGPIGGLVNGLHSVKVDGVPVMSPSIDEDGNTIPNIAGVSIETRDGTQDQASIPGFYAVEEEQATTAAEIKGGKASDLDNFPPVPYILSISDAEIDAARLTLGFPNLTSSTNEGDLNGTTVTVMFEISIDSGATWAPITDGGLSTDGTNVITGKTTSRYQRAFRFNLKKYGPGPNWLIRVSKLTRDPEDSKLRNSVFLDSWTRIVDIKLRYPNTALAGVRVDAAHYSSLPRRGYQIFGLLVKTPHNYHPPVYDPETSSWTSYAYYDATAFTGDMSTAPVQWSDNPAWCFYDLLTNDRYGLGGYIEPEDVDVFTLYQIGKYCDELVPSGFKDGNGDDILEPRFRCNLAMTTQEEAYKVILDFASIFRAMAYWGVGQISPVQDKPSDPVYLFTKANVAKDGFKYTSSARRARCNSVGVGWNDPADGFKQKIEYVEDHESLVQLGRLIQKEVVAIGCSSQGQAQRMGRWLLYTERFETEGVEFSAGLEGIMLRPGDVIHISDADRLSLRVGGRIIASDGYTHTLDAPVDIVDGETYYLEAMSPDGTLISRLVTSPPGNLTVIDTEAFPEPLGYMTTWILSSTALVPQTYRVLAVKEGENNKYDIAAVEHNPTKFDFIEKGFVLENPPDGGSGSPNPNGGDIMPRNIVIGEYLKPKNGDFDTIVTVSWGIVKTAVKYRVEWKPQNGNWTALPDGPDTHVEIPDMVPGLMYVRVASILSNGTVSHFNVAGYQVLGKTAPPATVTGFTGTITVNDVALLWNENPDLDRDHYVIKQEGAGATDAQKWAAGTVIFGDLRATQVTWQRPTNGNYNLMIKCVDTTGNESLAPAKLTLTVNAEDDYLTPTEKRSGKADYDRIWSEKAGLDTQATDAGVTTEKTTYDTAVTALNTYLLTLTNPNASAAWSGPNGDNTHQDNSHTGNWTDYVTTCYLGSGGGLTYNNKFRDVWAAADALKVAIVQASLDPGLPTETFRPKIMWDFTDVDPSGFTANGFSTAASASPDDKNARLWQTLSTGGLGEFTGFDIPGADGYIFMVRLRLNSALATWKGRAGYSTDGSTWPYTTLYKEIAAPKVGVWTIVVFDMRTMTAGTSIKALSSVKGYFMELGTGGANIDVDWAAAGTYGAGSRLDYDLALQDLITDFLGRADTKVFGNTVITGSTNEFPNPTSERTYAAGTFGALNVSSSAAHTGTKGRRIVAADHGVACTPPIEVTAGDGLYLAGWIRCTTGSGAGGFQATFKDADGVTVTSPSFANFQSSSTSWVYVANQFIVPATAVTMQLKWYANVTGGRTVDLDEIVLRKAADSWLLVNGAIEAYFARIGGMQTDSLAVGPFMQFRSSTNGLKLMGRPDGSFSRATSADRAINPSLLAENADDPAVYMDESRVFPSADLVVYDTHWGGTTEARGIVLNMGSPFSTSGQSAILVKWTTTSLAVYGMTGVGAYTASPLKTAATVPTTTSGSDKLTVVYYPTQQRAVDGTDSIRIKVKVNGAVVTTLSDTDLDKTGTLGVNFGGAKSGYGGLYLAGDVRVTNPQFGRGFVNVEGGAVIGDNFHSTDYTPGTATAPPSGFRIADPPFVSTFKTGGTASAQAEFGRTINVAGFSMGDVALRAMNCVDFLSTNGAVASASYRYFWKGNNNPSVRSGVPDITKFTVYQANRFDGTWANIASAFSRLRFSLYVAPDSRDNNLDGMLTVNAALFERVDSSHLQLLDSQVHAFNGRAYIRVSDDAHTDNTGYMHTMDFVIPGNYYADGTNVVSNGNWANVVLKISVTNMYGTSSDRYWGFQKSGGVVVPVDLGATASGFTVATANVSLVYPGVGSATGGASAGAWDGQYL